MPSQCLRLGRPLTSPVTPQSQTEGQGDAALGSPCSLPVPLPSSGLCFPTGPDMEMGWVQQLCVSKEIFFPHQALGAVPGAFGKGADSWEQFWPRSHQ